MGGSKPKPSGDPPTRWSTRRAKQFKDLRPYLFQGRRARIDKYNNNDGVHGVQAAAASVEDGEMVCAAGWITAQRVRSASRLVSGVSTLRSPPANAGGSGATATELQKIQDLNVVVVGLLNSDKLLKQLIKAMNKRANSRTLDLHNLCYLLLKRLQAMETCYKDLNDAHEKLEAEVRLQMYATEHQ